MQFGARMKYTEQYCMSNTITAICSLGSKHCVAMHAYMDTKLASQRVKGYHKKAHGIWQLNIHILRVDHEKKQPSPSKARQ